MSEEPFSKRLGYRPDPPLIYEDAPPAFRKQVFWQAEINPASKKEVGDRLRQILTRPDLGWDEVQPEQDLAQLLQDCDWYLVFDAAEALYALSATKYPNIPYGQVFETSINEQCRRFGLGYEMQDGRFQIRLSQPSQGSLDRAVEALQLTHRTAANELREAMHDLSRRPDDKTGAVQHAGAAIECLARDLCGDPKLTLGDIIKRHPHLFPGAYRKLAESVWGISSNRGRHVEEGGEPTLSEAMLLVETVTALVNYLLAEAKE